MEENICTKKIEFISRRLDHLNNLYCSTNLHGDELIMELITYRESLATIKRQNPECHKCLILIIKLASMVEFYCQYITDENLER